MIKTFHEKLDEYMCGEMDLEDVYLFKTSFFDWFRDQIGTENIDYAQVLKSEFFEVAAREYRDFYLDELYKIDSRNNRPESLTKSK